MTTPRPNGDHHHDNDHHEPVPRCWGTTPSDSTVSLETVRLAGPGPLLTAIPYLLGYQPADGSLVVTGITGRRIVRTARIELPDRTDLPRPAGLTNAWTMFTRPLRSSATEAVAVIAYTDPDWDDDLRAFAATAPVPVVDLLRVHVGRWWSLTCPDPADCTEPGCTPDGADLSADPAVVAPLIACGAGVPGTRQDLAGCLQPGPADLLDAVAARLMFHPARTRGTLYQAVADAHEARHGGPDPLSAGQAAVLLTAIADPLVRDACLPWSDEAAWWLWHDLLHAAPPGWVAPVATAIAVTAYQRGDGVIAAIAAEHALTDLPAYNLARIIQASLRAAIPPDAIRALVDEAVTGSPFDPDTIPHPGPPTR